MSFQDKTEAPTPHKREEARNEGRVAKSADLNSAVPLLAVLMVMRAAGPFMSTGFTELMRSQFSTLHSTEVNLQTTTPMIMNIILKACLLSAPVVLTAGAVGMAVNVMQVGMKIAPKSIAPDLNKLDFFKGIAKLVSPQAWVELLKSILKLGVVGYVVYSFLRTEYPSLIQLSGMPLDAIGSKVGELCWGVLLRSTSAIIILAMLDYLYQKLSFENTLKMTKQEVKEEYKRSEGDPQIKGQIRQRQREMAKRTRMLDDVPKADVIVTNPTRIAVALKYDPNKTAAPIVIAKGQRLVAERIKAIARENNIPIVENKPVARMIFKVVEIGHPIPEELYQAVAEILAFVYRLSQKQGMRR